MWLEGVAGAGGPGYRAGGQGLEGGGPRSRGAGGGAGGRQGRVQKGAGSRQAGWSRQMGARGPLEFRMFLEDVGLGGGGPLLPAGDFTRR